VLKWYLVNSNPLALINFIFMSIKQKIIDKSKEIIDEVIDIRRHIHKYPELSFHEYETSKYIKTKLTEFGIPFKDNYVKTGIVGVIEGVNPRKKIIALRADMDALPIEEDNNLDFISVNKGIMHACGHDVHSASLLGASKILNDLKESWEGTVLLIFQPAEEKLPGGAKLMMEEGALNDPKPELIIGQHVLPTLDAGKVGFKSGMYMASTDEIYISIKGKGGHAAMPHQINDTVLTTSHVIVALQQVVSRKCNTAIPSVLSFGKVEALGATNVIPSVVKIEGTFRTMDEEWRTEAHKHIRSIAESTAKGMGCEAEVEIKIGYPFLVNDSEITEKSRQASIDLLGEENVVELDLRMTAEDFAYYSQQYPTTFYRLGVKAKKVTSPAPLHSPFFMVDEDALLTSIQNMAYLAVLNLS
jgi:amidohydrolase